MIEKTINKHERTLEILHEHRNTILEEFLSLSEELSKAMKSLCETGIDLNRRIRLEEIENKNDKCHFVVSKAETIVFYKALDKMTNENAIEVFLKLREKHNEFILKLSRYNEILTMLKLLIVYIELQSEEEKLNL